jgi:Tol biopolymer transport system component
MASTQPGETDRAAIERLVGNLGSRYRLVRESAQKRLVEIGLAAVRPLRAAAESHDAEVRARAMAILKAIREAREVCVQELDKVPQPFRETRLFVSPNGQRLAYILKLGGKEILVCDGRQGPAWYSIGNVGPYSRDSKRLPYQASKDGKAYTLSLFAGEEDKAAPMNGKEGPGHKDVNHKPSSPDEKRFAYIATDDKGKKFVVVNGQPLKPYEGIGSMTFSPDGKRVAFTAKRDGKAMVVCDGKEGPHYPEVFYPMFSPDGKSLAYWARSAHLKKWFVIWDEKEMTQLNGEPQLAFSPDGRALACSTYSGGGLYRFAETVENLATGHDCASPPVFSPDSRHIACALGKDLRWWVCVDGKSLAGKYDPETVMCWDGPGDSGTSMTLSDNSPGFSADGRHVYWKGFRNSPGNLPPGNREHFIVCDGFEGPSHEGLWVPEDFRNHAKRLRYVVRDGERVRLMEFAWPEAMTWQDAVE